MSLPDDLYIDYKGWRFRPPFHCMYCGIEVDPLQWAFSRSCGGCDVSKSHTARLSIFDPRVFAGPHELIDPNDGYFLDADRFLSPADAEKYPVLNPSLTYPFPLTSHTLGCDQSDAKIKLKRVCKCTCLHTVHPVMDHFPECPEFSIAEPQD